jgi:uncharacterized protein YndB with AHSA1/START domain
MKWVLIVLGVLLGLVAVMWVVGAMLPKEHVASRMARYRQPPEAIWQAITSVEEMPRWRSDLKAIQRLPEENGQAGWVERSSFGDLPLRVEESAAPRRLVLRIADPNLPFGGTWTYEIEPVEGGATLRITERGEIRAAFFRFMSRFIFGYTATMEQYLRNLGKKFAEDVAPQP